MELELDEYEDLSIIVHFRDGSRSRWDNVTGTTANFLLNSMEDFGELEDESPYVKMQFDNQIILLNMKDISMVIVRNEEEVE